MCTFSTDYFYCQLALLKCSRLPWYAAYYLNTCQYQNFSKSKRGLRSKHDKVWVGMGNSHVYFYDITSWRVSFTCLWPYIMNFKWAHLSISWMAMVHDSSETELVSCCQWKAAARAQSAWKKLEAKTTQVNTCMAPVDHNRQGHAVHRRYKLCIVVEFALGKGHAWLTLISTRD